MITLTNLAPLPQLSSHLLSHPNEAQKRILYAIRLVLVSAPAKYVQCPPPDSTLSKRSAEADVILPRFCEGDGCFPGGLPEIPPESKRRSVNKERVTRLCALVCFPTGCRCEDEVDEPAV